MLILKIIEFILVFLCGMVFAILSLLVSRSTICDDIREKSGRHALRNHPKLKDGIWKWFFLTERIKHLKMWRYVFFILETILSVIAVAVITAINSFGSTDYLRIILGCTALLAIACKAILGMIPWGRYRN
jgi:hypothetical protein